MARTALPSVLLLMVTLFTAGTTSRAGLLARQQGVPKPDEYGDICWSREKEVLRNFAIRLKNEPNTRGYILTYAGRQTPSLDVARKRGERAKKYLIKLGLPAERIVAVDGGFREHLTWEIWVVPDGAEPPFPTPTVEKSDVKIIAKPKKKPCP